METMAVQVGVPVALLGFMSTMWPLKHTLDLVRLRGAKPSGKRPVPVSEGKNKPSWGPLTPAGVQGMHYGDIFYAGFGLMVYLYTWPAAVSAQEWPSLAGFVGSWASLVLARNLLLEVAFYEFWHQLLFGSLATDGITQHRYSEHNPYLPKEAGVKAQMSVWRERFWCTCGFCWSSLWECFIVHAWASGKIPACGGASGLASADGSHGAGPFGTGCQMADLSLHDVTARPLLVLWFVLAFPITTQFRGVHFFFVHRGMHPWFSFKRGLLDGDVGAFLYRHVHSLHHKSSNPGPWSSLSMHPVEHIFYFSCFALAFIMPYHPLHLLCNKYHTDISALGGHDGYGPPGADDVGHYLHHTKFECNYGFSFPNYLDRAFGTYDDGKKYEARRQERAAKSPDKKVK